MSVIICMIRESLCIILYNITFFYFILFFIFLNFWLGIEGNRFDEFA